MKSPLGAQTVLGDRHDPDYEVLLQEASAACGTRPRELSNGWRRNQIRDGSEKRSSENLIRQRGQRNDLNPGEFASRAGVRVVVLARAGRARWISARSMFEPLGQISPLPNSARTTFEPMYASRGAHIKNSVGV